MPEENIASPAEDNSFTPFEGMSEDEIKELVQVFLEDANEQLEKLNSILIALEQKNFSPVQIQDLYRIFHSFKGSAASFGFSDLSQVSHELEDILAPVKNGKLQISDSLISLLFYALDKLKFVFRRIQDKNSYSEILSVLSESIAKYVVTPQPTVEETESPFPFIPSVPDDLNYEINLREESIRIKLQKINRLIDLSSEMAVRKNYGQITIPKIMTLLAKVQEKEKEITKLLRGMDDGILSNNQGLPAHELCQGIVDFTGDMSDGLKALLDDFSRWFYQLNVLAEELRYEALMARMFPLVHLISQMNRVVRDIGKALGKRVELETEGENTEIDRRILEELKDPLIHILRNAVDHGIEAPGVRQNFGKPAAGTIKIRASQTGNAIMLDISDDGAGIDADSIRKAALERLPLPYSFDSINSMSSEEILNLIFVPGFSTAKSISEISGRGVGLDVVQNNIRRLHGQIRVTSAKNKGTTFHVTIPASLTIASVLIFEVGSFVFAIDTSVIVRTAVINASELEGDIDNLSLKYAGKQYQLARLGDYLKIPVNSKSRDSYYVALIHYDSRCMGLIVDRFLDHQEIIIRPLSMALDEARFFSGITFLPDGTLAFIIAPDALLGNLKDLPGSAGEKTEFVLQLDSSCAEDDFKGIETSIILLKTGAEIVGIPAHWILRKFEIPRQSTRSGNARRYLVFGNRKIPLLALNKCLNISGDSESETATAVICLINDRLLGLESDGIVSKETGWINCEKPGGTSPELMKAALKDGRELRLVHMGLLLPHLQEEKDGKPATGIEDKELRDLMQSQNKDAILIQCCVGGIYVGIPFQAVHEIVPSAEIQRFDGNIKNPRGFVNLRGECVEVYNLHGWLADNEEGILSSSIVVVVQKNGIKRGFVVDKVKTDLGFLSGQSQLDLPAEVSNLYPPVYRLVF